ncbi:hypothetical protein HYV57_02900 [Candidatus Peregrinibacteria bacterium]|nr:hypothetical protein [Candidatus Peregrinibacteria bacterium]
MTSTSGESTQEIRKYPDLCDLLETDEFRETGIKVPPAHSRERSKFASTPLLSALHAIQEATGIPPTTDIVQKLQAECGTLAKLKKLATGDTDLLEAALNVYRADGNSLGEDGGLKERRTKLREVLTGTALTTDLEKH